MSVCPMIMVIKNTVDMFCTSHFSHPIRFRAQGFRLDCRPPGRHCICTAPCCDTEFHAAPTHQLKHVIRLQDRKQNELRTCFGMQCLNGCPTQICTDTMSQPTALHPLPPPGPRPASLPPGSRVALRLCESARVDPSIQTGKGHVEAHVPQDVAHPAEVEGPRSHEARW